MFFKKKVTTKPQEVKKESKEKRYVSDEQIKEALHEVMLEPCICKDSNPNVFLVTKVVHEKLGLDTDKARIYEVILKEILR